ncbi:ATP-binding protein [Paenibacillus pasadenensis]|uniref:Circadian input-output histidine kinase CikA n=1 Tax=Paenibacillus pasadenensis TaxID=217090 RepID=A0A2N5NDQ9_9BACL|nr:ATP-binding protein [Paenibacillus pasadenensis]PLT48491.1 Two-component hybrid sensor and regulator [Paenibacillus pasadenensis]
MAFLKVFFTNISLLVTIAYLFNLGYKLFFHRIRPAAQQAAAALVFVASGILTMLFGLQLSDEVRFDLRQVPLLLAVLAFRSPWAVGLIGAGIGAGRLLFGIAPAAWAGVGNMLILGIAGALANVWFRKRRLSYPVRATITILGINLLNGINISLFGVIPFEVYWSRFFPLTFPLSVLLSGFFVYMIRDFSKEQERMKELGVKNDTLRLQTEELQAAKHELEEQAVQLKLASKYKSEFLANMSHELKTPLNSILLLSELIGDNEDERRTVEERRHGAMIHAAGRELLQQIEDILDLSRVEAGKLSIQIEPLSTLELMQSLQLQFEPQARRKGLRFDVEVDPEAPELLLTDPLRIRQILRNLLANAIKFTDAGGVALAVRAEPAADRTPWLRFDVVDSGIGIEPDKHELIFEAFRQADGAVTRTYGGTGLGLSISLQLAELLGGRLELESRAGGGSRFSLVLPARMN